MPTHDKDMSYIEIIDGIKAALGKSQQHITQLCHTVNTLSNQLGLGDKVRVDDFIITAKGE
jgi:hypothetical protein